MGLLGSLQIPKASCVSVVKLLGGQHSIPMLSRHVLFIFHRGNSDNRTWNRTWFCNYNSCSKCRIWYFWIKYVKYANRVWSHCSVDNHGCVTVNCYFYVCLFVERLKYFKNYYGYCLKSIRKVEFICFNADMFKIGFQKLGNFRNSY